MGREDHHSKFYEITDNLSLVAACGVLVTGLALNKVGVCLGHPSDYFETLYYVPCFVAGILLARHRHEAVAWFIRLGSGARALLLIAAILLFTYPSWMAPAWFSHAHRHHFDDILAVTLGGCAFMVWALGSQTVARFLRGRRPQFLGRISYSLYLLHAVVLLALAHALNGQVPTGVIIALMWILVLPLAALSQRWSNCRLSVWASGSQPGWTCDIAVWPAGEPPDS